MANVANAADPLGWDMRVSEDLDPSGRPASGLELAADEILHRLSEDTLLLTGAPNDAVEFGENVRLWIGEALTQDSIEAKKPRIEEVLRRSPRLASVAVDVTIATGDDASRYRFLVNVAATTITGQTLERVVGVSQVTVEFLAQGR